MYTNDYWQMFLKTGAPAFYLQYKLSKKEEDHVPDDPRPGSPGHGLQ